MRRLLRWTLVSLVAVLALSAAGPSQAAPAPALSEVDAKIEIVWPHGNLPVARARLANVTAYLFLPNSRVSVPCDVTPVVRLWRAVDNEPPRPVQVGVKRLVETSERTFPAWDFNDVDVSPATWGGKVYFTLSVDSVQTHSNVWIHAADALTFLPQPPVPDGIYNGLPADIDARIQVVWPRNNAPVAQASYVNVTVAFFKAGTRHALRAGQLSNVYLYSALNAEPMRRVGQGAPRLVTAPNGLVYEVWDIDNIPVWQAQDPASKYVFQARLELPTVQASSNLWIHGTDGRTIFPQQDQPLGGCGAAYDPTVLPQCALAPVRGFGKVWQSTPVIQTAMGCPTGPEIAAPVLGQRFEHGVLLWVDSEENGHKYGVWVLLESGAYLHVGTTWREGEPEPPRLTPPPGRYEPRGRLGKVWREEHWLREQFGWAIDPQAMQVQGVLQLYQKGSMIWTPWPSEKMIYALGLYPPQPHGNHMRWWGIVDTWAG